jgi:ABC-type uncharacterized transport system YnjBCD substrate-binding protein
MQLLPILYPVLENAKGAWDQAENLMSWFSRLVATSYAWSDSLIRWRQKKVDTKYEIKQAEKEAKRIMVEQEREIKAAKGKVTGSVKRAILEDEFLEFLARHGL